MILRVWLRIISIIFLVAAPLAYVEYIYQRESVTLVFDLADRNMPGFILDSHLKLLKKLSTYDPANQRQYREEFEKTVEARSAKEDLRQVRDRIVQDLLKQTRINALIVLVGFSALALWISRGIVKLLRRLAQENQTQSRRLERLRSIESWQKLVRMLVHELRAPITPIKLLATDMENKYHQLRPEKFENYLKQGTELISHEVKIIEKMLESFTKFAKLPDIKKEETSLADLIEGFVESYRNFKPESLELAFEPSVLRKPTIHLDPNLLRQMFFNLVKNAVEANPTQKIQVSFRVRQNETVTWIEIQNTGNPIPEHLAGKIFDLHVSTKVGMDQANFGIGLTISKKIALDHGGDLYLLRNNAADGVIFELEIPSI